MLQVFGLLLSAAAALIGSLVLWNLRMLTKQLSDQEKRIDRIEVEQRHLSERKSDCQRDFVSSEQWIRSEAYTRSKLDKIAESVGNLAGSLKVIEQMPRICGQIARDIVREMKNGGN